MLQLYVVMCDLVQAVGIWWVMLLNYPRGGEAVTTSDLLVKDLDLEFCSQNS